MQSHAHPAMTLASHIPYRNITKEMFQYDSLAQEPYLNIVRPGLTDAVQCLLLYYPFCQSSFTCHLGLQSLGAPMSWSEKECVKPTLFWRVGRLNSEMTNSEGMHFTVTCPGNGKGSLEGWSSLAPCIPAMLEIVGAEFNLTGLTDIFVSSIGHRWA